MMRKRIFKYIGLVFMAILISNSMFGQKLTIKLADKAYHDFSWREAIDLYTYAYEKDENNVNVIRKLADCYRNIGQTEQVESWLSLIIEMDEAYPEDIFNYSMALKSNGKYEDSEVYLREYSMLRPEDGRINKEQSILEYITFLVQDSTRFDVQSLPFNTTGADWGPTFYENKLVYVSTGDPDESRDIKYNWDQLPFLDLYYVNIDEYGNYSQPDIFAKEIMSSFHDGPATFDAQKKRMYFNSNRSTKNSSRKEEENNLQIYYADYENGKWVEKGGFKYNNERDNYRHPSIDKTGEVLYFSSDRPGGKGKSDIWWCRKINGEWGEPINLEEINTEGTEVFPFIATDGVLYFASDGLGGMGGLDIYMSLPDRGVFKPGENLGYPVNTASDDFGIVLDDVGMSGYFSSSRPGGLGHDDIYKLDILEIPVYIGGTVRDRINTFEISGARIALLDENSDTLETAYSKEDGEFLFKALKQRNYKLVVTNDSYIPVEKDVSTFGKLPNEKIEVEVFIEMNFEMMDNSDQLEPLSLEMRGDEELQVIQIEHINYGFDSDRILPEAAFVLDQVIELIKQYPDLEIMVESHTDAKGSDEYNLRLSKLRATSAYKYLSSRGVSELSIEYSGFGETQLLNHCEDGVDCSDEENAINRRSIIKVVRRGKYKSKRNSRSIFYF